MSAPKPKRGRESEEGLSVSEEVTFGCYQWSISIWTRRCESWRWDEVGTSETALDTIPGGCSSQCCANEEQSFLPKDKSSLQVPKIQKFSPVGISSIHGYVYAFNEKWCFAYTVDIWLSTIGSHLAKWEKMFSVKKGSKIGRKLLRSSQLMKALYLTRKPRWNGWPKEGLQLEVSYVHKRCKFKRQEEQVFCVN